MDSDTDAKGKMHSFKLKNPVRGMSWTDGLEFSTDPSEKYAHKRLPETPIHLIFQKSPQHAPLPSFDGTPVPILNHRMKEIILLMGIVDINFYPVILESQSGEIISDEYQAFKTIGFVDQGEVDLAAKKMFFRMRDHNTEIIVHEKLKKKIEKEKIPLIQFFSFSGIY